MAKQNKHSLNYKFHNPNTPEDTADLLIKLFVAANKPKAEAVIQAAAINAADKAKTGTIHNIPVQIEAPL